ncbi:hypothetical protein GCM10008967_30090 [Bacillus carboniphilus]|uniref:YesK-like protein n=1 Tax=Bacillus carboniphilus TaxID=86663 RepID=A0ABP3G9L9_9BACI
MEFIYVLLGFILLSLILKIIQVQLRIRVDFNFWLFFVLLLVGTAAGIIGFLFDLGSMKLFMVGYGYLLALGSVLSLMVSFIWEKNKG